MIIILIGPPGSGKGTQAVFLSESLQIPHLSTGDMFRRVVQDKSDEGKILEQYLAQGRLVPAELVNAMVQKTLDMPEYQKGCLLDGYPRTIAQAAFLDEKVKQRIVVICFSVDDDVVIKRLSGRFSCSSCGRIYNKYYLTPRIDGVCDVCHEKNFVFRNDDNEAVVRKRLQVYKEETEPLISYYQEKKCCYFVDGNKLSQQVTEEIKFVVRKISQ